MPTWKRYLLFCAAITLASPAAVVLAAPTAALGDGTAHCKMLEHADFSHTLDAPTQITQTRWATGDGAKAGYCAISGYVTPRTEFQLHLPSTAWNGKFIELGCGGPCGTLQHIEGCADPLRRGYACIVSDGGHKTNESQPMLWSYRNPQAAVEYFVRASHVTALAGKAIAQRYYDRIPGKSYFMGCSSGGIQAMWEAQKFPTDFNGIVVGGPALNLSRIWLNWLWANRAFTDEAGKALFDRADLQLLHQAAVARCDLDDGVKDGVIGDPRTCGFNPAELRCNAGKNPRCLTARQSEAAAKIYSGPFTSTGERIAAPLALRGSELSWLDMFSGSESNPNSSYTYLKEWYRYSIFDIDLGQEWQPKNFDFDWDYTRLGAMQALEPNNPDLHGLKAAGGKLLAFTGWNDAIEGVLNTIGYYEAVEKVMGGRPATQDFFRLFVVPGMNHCADGDGAWVIDYLSYLEAWVERNEAPEQLLGAHPKNPSRSEFPLDRQAIAFTRPVYPYPIRAKYQGHGDPKQAASFVPY